MNLADRGRGLSFMSRIKGTLLIKLCDHRIVLCLNSTKSTRAIVLR